MATTTKSGEKPVKSKPAAAKAAAPPKPAATAKPDAPVKPAAAKAAAKPVAEAAPAKVSAAAAKPAAPKKEAASAKPKLAPLAPDQRRFYVEVAAYYIAERRGFHGESQLNDWVEAENEIDRLLSEGILNP
jgi:hypothetical protein